jgi:cysteinyl-tRNA synthetase
MKEKKNPTDFALWKFSTKPGERQQEYKSPWGIGYPGWHLECSAMSMKYLGEHFDIHTGGQEHIQVHHQNEIAQSEGATKKKFVNYWIHTAWLTSKGEKISKSKGGLYTVSQLEEKGFDPIAFRYLSLTAHYRKPLEFSLESLSSAKTAYNKLKERIIELKQNPTSKGTTKKYKAEFLKSINDDLNIPKALSLIWTILKDKDIGNKQKLELILDFDKIFSLNLDKIKETKTPKEVLNLLKQREKARKEKSWKEADKIRNKITKLGFSIEDSEKGPAVKKIQ